MYFSSADKKMLAVLFKEQSKRQLYSFYKEYGFSPAQLSRFVREYKNIGVISIQDDLVELTGFGNRWVLKNRREIFLKIKEKSWRYIPVEWRKIKKGRPKK